MAKGEKEKLERKYISEFIAYFFEQKLKPNDFEIEYIKESIKKIIKLEMKELGYKLEEEAKEEDKIFKIEFVNNPENTFSNHIAWYQKQTKSLTRAFFFNMKYITDLLKSDDEKERMRICDLLYIAIFHEIQHFRQELLSKLNVSCRDVMLYAKEFILTDYLEDDFLRKKNYKNLAIENNANVVANKQYNNLKKQKNKDFIFNSNEQRFKYIFQGYFGKAKARFANDSFKFKKGIDREDLFEMVLASGVIENESEILTTHPILKKEYKLTSYGIERRSVLELIESLEQEKIQIGATQGIKDEEKHFLIEEAEKLYYKMIYRSMEDELYFIKEHLAEFNTEDFRNFAIKAKIIDIYTKNSVGAKNDLEELYSAKQTLGDIIQCLGKEGFKHLIRRDGK